MVSSIQPQWSFWNQFYVRQVQKMLLKQTHLRPQSSLACGVPYVPSNAECAESEGVKIVMKMVPDGDAVSTHPSHQHLESQLRHAIEHASHLLPAQGPIQVFIHHNTLHAFEDLPFDEAVRQGAAVFNTQPYLAEAIYRAALAKGRIRVPHLRDFLIQDLGTGALDQIDGLTNRLELRMAMLENPLWTGSEPELNWHMAETHARERFAASVPESRRNHVIADTRRWMLRDARVGGAPKWFNQLPKQFSIPTMESWDMAKWQAFTLESIWAACFAGFQELPSVIMPLPHIVRHRDGLLKITGIDPDLPVNELLIRFTAAYLDQGVSHWPLPDRETGFYSCFLQTYSQPLAAPDRWRSTLQAEVRRLITENVSPIQSLLESLWLLGVTEAEWDEYIAATVLPLRGWGGMIQQMLTHPDRVARPIKEDGLLELIAVRLILDRLAVSYVAKQELGYQGPLSGLRALLQAQLPQPQPTSAALRVYPVFQLAQVFGWTPHELTALSPTEWQCLYHEIETFDSFARRRVFQRGFEAQFREQTLDAIGLHQRQSLKDRPRFQAITCLDEREESFRRHMEEVAPNCETFGAAGFFGVAMYYKGSAEPNYTPLCPIVLTPQHWVEEKVCDSHTAEHARKAKTRKIVGSASHQLHVGTRTFAIGALITGSLGVLASIPLIMRIMFPALAGRIRRNIGQAVRPPKMTELKLERVVDRRGPGGDEVGYQVAEMATTAERFLRDIGLTKTFARLIFILGHGSSSLNNPHKSAYDCGACGGSPGAPNGRALAQMLNDSRVRERLARNGIVIPADTHFVGGFHNTCDDTVPLADVNRVPASHRAELAAIEQIFLEVARRNAHERCRRFMSASLAFSTADAHKHVQNRSEDLGQTRPELGHATNAICFVGRREMTRGLFFDRRAFLASYDPLQDDATGFTLMRLLSAAVPVCGGINLEYYFSHVDSAGYGCGTKLPHNISSLLGVMDGAASDLRTGLPWQMVEIHEPIRLLFVVESTPEIILGIMNANALISNMIRNGWVQFTLVDPITHQISIYENGDFVTTKPVATQLPTAPSSIDWYRGWREHLEFAVITGKGA